MDEIRLRNKAIFWKVKGITAKATYMLFIKYSEPGNFELVPNQSQFSENFKAKFAIPLLESHLQILLASEDHFVGRKCLTYAIMLLSAATLMEYTMEKLKPYV